MASEYINPLVEINDEIKTDPILSFIYNEFSKPPFENLLYLNIAYLIDNSKEIEFRQEWNYSPHRAALDIYGSKFYFKLINLLNPVPNIFYFTKDNFPTLKIVPLQIIDNLRGAKWES